MNWFARELGYGEEAAFWAQAGLLHDLDFERYPEEHCVKVREIMEPAAGPALIHAVVSHGWGMTEATPSRSTKWRGCSSPWTNSPD